MSDNALSPDAQAILSFVQANGYLILDGKYWDGLYKLLPMAPDGRTPPRPLILAGAQMATDKQKFDRLVEHIEWADRVGNICGVANYLFKLQSHEYQRVILI